jgi:hypothetical protein
VVKISIEDVEAIPLKKPPKIPKIINTKKPIKPTHSIPIIASITSDDRSRSKLSKILLEMLQKNKHQAKHNVQSKLIAWSSEIFLWLKLLTKLSIRV